MTADNSLLLCPPASSSSSTAAAAAATEVVDVGPRGGGRIVGVSGPVVKASGLFGAKMHELVKVGHQQLLGEIIGLDKDVATIQVYEDTSGLCRNEPVERTNDPLSVTLGPGLLSNIYDGIQRPLKDIHTHCNDIYVPKGVFLSPISLDKIWHFYPNDEVKLNDTITGGTIIGYVNENELIKHYIMVKPGVSGKVVEKAEEGDYKVTDILVVLETNNGLGIENVTMLQKWPVRVPRPIVRKRSYSKPLFTGQRVLDSLFPCALGGTVAIPGAFGCGKTVISQCISKFSNSDIVVYVGCGERGNEMAEVLMDFPELFLDFNGKKVSIMNRTTLVANTSNMPVSAREASIYTGITIAEYFRDQGYNVSLMADSTSRWAEALREISGRLGEMPADSGYPAYLSSRLAAFYERGGLVECKGSYAQRQGSITIVGAVSPPSEDMSDPVTTATLSIVQCFWGLDKRLAQKKHFPSLNWSISFSKCANLLEDHYNHLDPNFLLNVSKCRDILQAEQDLSEIVQLVGKGSLPEEDKLKIDIAKLIIEDFLQQNGISKYDQVCEFKKTALMLKTICLVYEMSMQMLLYSRDRSITHSLTSTVLTWSALKENLDKKKIFSKLRSFKFIFNEDVETEMQKSSNEIEKAMNDLRNATI